MPNMPVLRADSERVWVATVQERDIVPYARAVQRSAERIGWWNPVDPYDLGAHLQRQNVAHRTFIIHARQPSGDHDIVGKVNVSNVVRGRFQSATMGYDAYDPYAGTGLFAEGMRLVLGLAFAAEPGGLGLHRLEANVQPANTTSAGLLRSLGFRRERHVRDMLWLEGGGRPASWRDHDSYALTATETPTAYRSNATPRVVVLVNGLPGSGKSSIAGRIASELAVPLWSKDIVKETLYDGADETLRDTFTSTGPGASIGRASSRLLWRMLADSVVGGVIDNNLRASDRPFVLEGLAQADISPDRVLQVWCDVPPELARRRSMARRDRGERHPIHGSVDAEARMWDSLRTEDCAPLDVGTILRVDTSRPVSDRDIVRAALTARATALG